jgi:hypothetical protein
MACFLRIWGVELDVDTLVASTGIAHRSLYRKGEPRSSLRPDEGKLTCSGISYHVSDAGFDQFKTQKEDAIAYLSEHSDDIEKIVSAPGVDGASLDFGIKKRDVAMQCDIFPARLISLAARFGLEIELSQYAISDAKSNR